MHGSDGFWSRPADTVDVIISPFAIPNSYCRCILLCSSVRVGSGRISGVFDDKIT
jgi:hypothetical protein